MVLCVKRSQKHTITSFTFRDFLDVNSLLEFSHVPVVGRDVEYRGQRVGQLDWELLVLRAEPRGRVEAAGVAGKVIPVAPVERNQKSCLVVILDDN